MARGAVQQLMSVGSATTAANRTEAQVAEADGNRSHQRQRLPLNGFEDRAAHQDRYASGPIPSSGRDRAQGWSRSDAPAAYRSRSTIRGACAIRNVQPPTASTSAACSMWRRAKPSRNDTPVMSTTRSPPDVQATAKALMRPDDVPASNSPDSTSVVKDPTLNRLADPRLTPVSVSKPGTCMDMAQLSHRVRGRSA